MIQLLYETGVFERMFSRPYLKNSAFVMFSLAFVYVASLSLFAAVAFGVEHGEAKHQRGSDIGYVRRAEYLSLALFLVMNAAAARMITKTGLAFPARLHGTARFFVFLACLCAISYAVALAMLNWGAPDPLIRWID